ncbi:hypothetical protein RI367_007576 [Sorochytrium milnesiophthora]
MALPDRQDFECLHLLPNRPVLLDAALTEHWRSRREWVQPDGRSWDVDALGRLFGDSTVDVTDCSKTYFNDMPKQSMTLRAFLAKCQQCPDGWCGYLKDWHFVQQHPSYEAYTLPDLFADDWLNLWTDYRFVYMGLAGTWTPFHADVVRSYSWSANVCGRKRWYLFPPGQDHLFRDINGHTVFNIHDYDKRRFPRFHEAVHIEVTQEAGQTLFVPSGWFHQVENLEDTISINHNWCNAFCFDLVWASICGDYAATQASIADLRAGMDQSDWTEMCQRMLRALAGANFDDVWDWMQVVVRHLLLNRHAPVTVADVRSFHSTLDRVRAERVMSDTLSFPRTTVHFDQDGFTKDRYSLCLALWVMQQVLQQPDCPAQRDIVDPSVQAMFDQFCRASAAASAL